jgi:hypothetical protein
MSETAPKRAAKIFNGKYTVLSPSGEHRTFRIKTMPSADKQREQNPDPKFKPFAPDKRVIGLLTGSDNQSSYTNFGFVDDDGIHVWTSKRGTDGGEKSQYEKNAACLWSLLTTEKGFFAQRGFTVEQSCTCVVCNRELTNPESILTGIGPECAGRKSGGKRKARKPKRPHWSISGITTMTQNDPQRRDVGPLLLATTL